MKQPAALPSWNDGSAKAAILDFVRSVTAPGEAFLPPAARRWTVVSMKEDFAMVF